MSQDLQRLDAQLCFALFGAWRAMTRAYDPLLRPLGLDYPSYLALLALWEESPLRVPELAERLGLEPEEAGAVADCLQSRGLIKRTGPFDETPDVVSLTEAGVAKKAHLRFIPERVACRLAEQRQGDDERVDIDGLRKQLHTLATFLDHVHDPR